MKIAVQLFGNLRTYEACAPSLRANLLDRYDCDVFLHTWDKLDHNTPTWYDNSSKCDPLSVDDGICGRIKALYNPVAFKVETQDFINDTATLGPHKLSLRGIQYMLYGQYAANAMRLAHEAKTCTVYDYVITLRPDLLLLRPLVFEDYAQEFAFQPKASIHLVHKEVNWIENERFISIPLMLDCMFIAKPESMTTITNFFKHTDRYLHDMPRLLPHVAINPEVSLQEYLYEHGIFPRQYRFYYAIKRKNGIDDVIIYPPEMLTRAFRLKLWWKTTRRNTFLTFRQLALGGFAISRHLIPAYLRAYIVRWLESKIIKQPQGRTRYFLEKVSKYLKGKSI